MKRFLFLITWLLIGNVLAQPAANSGVTVSNVRVELDSVRAKIVYDLANVSDLDSVYIRVESRRSGFLSPKTVTGDVGKGVSAGPNKTIYWDYRLDGVRIEDEIRATVLVKPHSPQTRKIGGGPVNALLSAVVPGLGTIFVQPNRKVGWRPAITATYGGLLAYGLVQRSRSKNQYDLYKGQPNDIQAEPYYNQATRHHHRYLMATRIAAAVWLCDVTYTLLKGLKNEKQKRQLSQQVVVDWVGARPTVGMRLRF